MRVRYEEKHLVIQAGEHSYDDDGDVSTNSLLGCCSFNMRHHRSSHFIHAHTGSSSGF